MTLNMLKTIYRSPRCILFNTTSTSRFYSLWEPDYLDADKSDVPLYPELNIQMRSYSFPVLEKYQHHVHKLAVNLNIDVDNSWPLPAKVSKVKLFKENTTVVENEYVLNMYERNTQVSKVSSIAAPIFLRLLEASLPEGVNLSVFEYDPTIERKRYIPDKTLLDLKTELNTLNESK